MLRFIVVSALYLSLSQLVLASSLLQAPTLSLAVINDTSGRYDVSFNALSDIPQGHDYRLYESTDSGESWSFISSYSTIDSLPYVTPFSNRSNGVYQYKGYVCVIRTTDCSPSSAVSSATITRNPIDQYALEFNGVDSYVNFGWGNLVSIYGPAEVSFKWTYVGPSKNIVMSESPASTNQNYLYLSSNGLGFNLGGADQEWNFSTEGTHTYLMKMAANGAVELFVDGVFIGQRTFSKANPIYRFTAMGAVSGFFGEGVVHWLKMPGWSLSFEEGKNSYIANAYGAGVSVVSAEGVLWKQVPSLDQAEIIAPSISSRSSLQNSFQIDIVSTNKSIDYEYRLYERGEAGGPWKFLTAITSTANDNSLLSVEIAKNTNAIYDYKAALCLKSTTHCSAFSAPLTVRALAEIVEPRLSAPTVSDVSGRFDIHLNAPDNVDETHEYKVYESSDNGNNWRLVDTKSRVAGDEIPFVTTITDRENGDYLYRAQICETNTCSLDSVPIAVKVSKLAVQENRFALEFDGVDDHVQLSWWREISLNQDADLEFRWTYVGPDRNIVLSLTGRLSGSTHHDHLYISSDGFGINVSGVDTQWNVDTSGTHTYMLRTSSSGGLTLFVDGEQFEEKTTSVTYPIKDLGIIGATRNFFGRGAIHWLKLALPHYLNDLGGASIYTDGWFFPFEDQASRTEDVWNSGSPAQLHSTQPESWIHLGSQDEALIMYPPVFRGSLNRSLDIDSNTLEITFEAYLKNTQINYEYSLYESSDDGESWSLLDSKLISQSGGPQFWLGNGRKEREYRYRGKICLEGTSTCTGFSKELTVINTGSFVPKIPEVYTPEKATFSELAPCFSWEDLGDDITYSISISEDNGVTGDAGNHYFRDSYVLSDVSDNEVCWSESWSRYVADDDGVMTKVSTTSPTELETGRVYYWHVWSINEAKKRWSRDHSVQRFFFTGGLLPPSITAPSISDGNRYEIQFNAPWGIPDYHEYSMYESADGGSTWNLLGSISKDSGGLLPFKTVVTDKPQGEYQYKAKVCGVFSADVSHCSDFSSVINVTVVEAIAAPVLTAPALASKDRYEINYNAPLDVPLNHEYRIYESTDNGVTWVYTSYISRAAGLQPPFISIRTNSDIGTYQYKAKICLNDVGTAEVCSRFSEVVTVSVVESIGSPRVIYIHTDLLGSPVAESDQQGRVN